MQIFETPFPILGEGEGTEKPKPISRYFEKPIPKPIPTFEKTDQKPKTDTDPALVAARRESDLKQHPVHVITYL